MRTRFLSWLVSERFGWLRVAGCSVSIWSVAACFQPRGNDSQCAAGVLMGEKKSVLPFTSLLLVLFYKNKAKKQPEKAEDLAPSSLRSHFLRCLRRRSLKAAAKDNLVPLAK